MAKKVRAKKKEKKNIPNGIVHIQSTFNNTIITITDPAGNVVAWSSSGVQGFKGSRKSTPFAAQLAAADAVKKAKEHGVRPGFEGGQMPIHRRLPKRGFTNIFKKNIAVINIRDLSRFEQDSIVDEDALFSSGFVKGKIDGIKLLAQGEINIPLTVRLSTVSKNAREKILAAGGNIEIL